MLLNISKEVRASVFIVKVQDFLFGKDFLLLMKNFKILLFQNIIYLVYFGFIHGHMWLDDPDSIWDGYEF